MTQEVTQTAEVGQGNAQSGVLVNQVALVTGATRGIGRAIAVALAKAGATVIGTATSESGAETISSYLNEISPTAGKGVVFDVTDVARCSTLIDEIQKEYGNLSHS